MKSLAALLLALCATAHADDIADTLKKTALVSAETAGTWCSIDKTSQKCAEASAKADAAMAEYKARLMSLLDKPAPRIGMTDGDVLQESSWGRPNHVNRTQTGKTVREQWVYGDNRYLYFTNGKLTSIQSSND